MLFSFDLVPNKLFSYFLHKKMQNNLAVSDKTINFANEKKQKLFMQ